MTHGVYGYVRHPMSAPVWLAEKQALRNYFEWLSNEIKCVPIHGWKSAIGLCRKHSWGFVRISGTETAVKLVKATKDYWLNQLQNLEQCLAFKPPDSMSHRFAGAIRQLRDVRQFGENRPLEPPSFRNRLKASLKYLSQSPAQILPGLRERWLREVSSCQACECIMTAGDRTCDLLARGLGDPVTRSLYSEGGGVCFRHLPGVLKFARRREAFGTILDTARVQLELLEWELTKFLRKQNWSVRYEPKGWEGSAWRRAVSQYSGI